MNAILARLGRGYARMWAWAYRGASRPFRGARAYRHAAEQANHVEQAAQTQVSIGLMAAAAQQGDDDHRIQAMQTELTLRARKAVLEQFRAERGLTREERGELESIDRGLASVVANMETTEPAGGFARLWDAPPPPERPAQGALYRVGSVLIGLGQWLPILFIVGAVFAITGWGSAIWNGVKIGWLERRVEQLTEQRDAACSPSEMEGDTSRAACRQLAQMHMQAVENARIARAQAAATATNIESERRRTRAAQRREQERQRANQELLATDTPPDWGGLLRNDEPGEAADPAAGAPDRDSE